jgi:hypothetical protein
LVKHEATLRIHEATLRIHEATLGIHEATVGIHEATLGINEATFNLGKIRTGHLWAKHEPWEKASRHCLTEGPLRTRLVPIRYSAQQTQTDHSPRLATLNTGWALSAHFWLMKIPPPFEGLGLGKI